MNNLHIKMVDGTKETRLTTVRVIDSINLVFSLLWIRLIVRAASRYSEHAGKDSVGLIGLFAKLVVLSTREELKEVDDETNNGLTYYYKDLKNIVEWVNFNIEWIESKKDLSGEKQHELVEYKLISITLRELLLPNPEEIY